ncbi:MAG: hypothetical protein LBJ21_06745 [Acidobacteriota bacterium]|jgi:hypothetical protein|nr:hypothetical protein [Acidobacteriota bacterium]
MPIVAVSGHSRKVGKTSIAEGLIAALPEYDWTALKISSHRHSGDFQKGYAIIEETNRDGETDTSRFLRSGARRAFWIQAERIEAAIPAVRAIIENSPYVVIEGNGVLDFIAADFSILVLNGGVTEFKESARGIISRANALVLIGETAAPAEWEDILKSAPENAHRFKTGDPRIFPQALKELLRSRVLGFLEVPNTD